MPWITGTATEAKIWLCLPLPQDAQYIGNVLGVLNDMTKQYNWDVVGTASKQDSINYATYALENYTRSPEMSLIQDVRLTDEGLLEKLIGGEWIAAGDHITPDQAEANTLAAGQPATAAIEGDTFVFGIPQGIQGIQGIQGEMGSTGGTGIGLTVPMSEQFTTSMKDRWCYASGIVAKLAADTALDFAEVMQAGETFSLVVGSQLFEGFTDAITVGFGSVLNEPITEILIQGVTLNAINYVRNNIADAEAIAKAQEIIYCGIKAAVIADDTSNVSIYIAEELSEEVLMTFTRLDPSDVVFQLAGFGDATAEAFLNSGTDFLGEFIVGFYLAHDLLWNDLVGISDPIPTVVETAMARAVFIDGRDCAEFACNDEDWVQVFDFTVESYSEYFRPINNGDIYGDRAEYVTAQGWRDVRKLGAEFYQVVMGFMAKSTPEEAEVFSVEFTYDSGDFVTRAIPNNAWRFPNDDGTFDRNPYDDGGTYTISTDIFTGSPQVQQTAIFANNSGAGTLNQLDNAIGVTWFCAFAEELIDLSGYVFITKAVIKGHGVNPYTLE